VYLFVDSVDYALIRQQVILAHIQGVPPDLAAFTADMINSSKLPKNLFGESYLVESRRNKVTLLLFGIYYLIPKLIYLEQLTPDKTWKVRYWSSQTREYIYIVSSAFARRNL
jgi:hypothetical protein